MSLEDFSKRGFFKEITEIHLNTGGTKKTLVTKKTFGTNRTLGTKKTLVTKQPLEKKQPFQIEECLLFPITKDSRFASGGSFPSLSGIVDGKKVFKISYSYKSTLANICTFQVWSAK